MKKILGSVGVLALVGALVLGATGAFFSDTETSTGNTFTAGAIDLKIDSECSYNDGNPGTCGEWSLKDLDPTSDKFFDFSDIKPGDFGENTISLHVYDNDAYLCAEVSSLESLDNGQTEPEALVDNDGLEGELDDEMVWTIWRDDGVGDDYEACNNILNDGEVILAEGAPTEGVLTLYDSSTGALPGDTTTCLGVSWSLPAESENITQTDILTADISFTAVQSRNNDNFVCGREPQEPEMSEVNLENKNNDWQIIAGDQIFGLMTYSVEDDTFHGTVTGQGLEPNARYQITLNGPGSCTATDDMLAGFGANLFQSGYWNNWAPSLSPNCVGDPGEGLYNMNLIGDEYTVESDGSGNINYAFNLALPSGNYSGVKVLVKKTLQPFQAPWTDPDTVHTTNLFEVASISFTVN
ncbi:MAG: hypothetical protein JW740_02850 [Candidatus Zambryskibacteria bacterium]|nr:hypothetical protein [Candidatus Zambryskibacteria bacterium]